jgi:3-dehydroquinate dehydratase type I
MICLSFGSKDRKLLEKVIETYDFIELRLDLCDFSDKELKHYISKIKRSIISHKGDEDIAIPQLLKGIEYGSSIVDINILYSKPSLNYLFDGAIENKSKILLSYHEYLKPNLKYLKEMHAAFMVLKPDFIKIVFMCNKFSEYFILLEFIKHIHKSNSNITTVFALGQFSKFSRVVAEILDMPIVYTALNEQYQTVDNQIAYDDLKTIMEILK